MLFKINSFDKTTDLYEVGCDTGESKYVTGYQIVQVMLQGYKFVNAKITKKGFGIITDNGTRWVQINGLNKQMQSQMHAMAEKERLEAEQAKAVRKSPIKKPITQAIASERTVSSYSSKKLFFRGDTFLTEEALCKKYNRDLVEFKKMRSIGYSVEESLGLKQPRTLEEVLKEKRLNEMRLDQMARARGDW